MTEPSRTKNPSSYRWVGARAVAWVIDESDVPNGLFATLIVIARHADDSGRNAYPSVKTIATEARKSERQASRDIATLKKLGHLTPGSPAAVAHLPIGSRPEVYDIPIHIHRSGDVTHDTPTDDTPDMDDMGGVTCAATSPDASDTPGMSPMTPKEDLQPKEEPNQPNPSPTPGPTATAASVGLNPGRKEEAISIINTTGHDIYGGDLKNLTNAVVDALDRGWSKAILERELSKGLGGLGSPVGGLIARMRDLGEPPAVKAETPKAPCPHPDHHGQPNTLSCGQCRGDVNAGIDPYAAHENLRPDGFWDAYPRAATFRARWAAEKAAATSEPEPPTPRAPQQPTTTPATTLGRGTSTCDNRMCRNGVIKLGKNLRRCTICAGTRPTTGTALTDADRRELANVPPEQPRRRPTSQHPLAELLGGIGKDMP
jgi:hypothetical protein